MIGAIKRILKSGDDLPAGCGFLSPREIEDSLDGKLSGKRLDAFNSHQQAGCAPCALLAADLEVFSGVTSRGTLDSERREFRETEPILKAHLRQALDKIDEKRHAKSARGFSWNWVLATASTAMLLTAVAIPFLRGTGPSADPLSLTLPDGTTYEVEAMLFSPRPAVRGVVRVADMWESAFASYKAEDFVNAEQKLAAIIDFTTADHEKYDAAVYRGNALIQLGRFEEATGMLRWAVTIGEDQGFACSDANYYLGWALLKTGDAEQAVSALQASEAIGDNFSDDATKLLEQLNRLED